MSGYTVFGLPYGFRLEAEPGRSIMWLPSPPPFMSPGLARALAEALPKAAEIAEMPEEVAA